MVVPLTRHAFVEKRPDLFAVFSKGSENVLFRFFLHKTIKRYSFRKIFAVLSIILRLQKKGTEFLGNDHHHHHHHFLTERESISDDITSSFHYTLYRILASTVIFDTLNQHLSFYTKTDFDKCKDQDLNKCCEKAKCTNTEGSYNCTFIDGYVGDGFLCQGNGCIFVVYFITIYMMVN